MKIVKTLFPGIFAILSLISISSFTYCEEHNNDKSSIQIDKPKAGMLYFASYNHEDNQQVIYNKYIIGALYTIHWAEIEPQKGIYKWDNLDRFMSPL